LVPERVRGRAIRVAKRDNRREQLLAVPQAHSERSEIRLIERGQNLCIDVILPEDLGVSRETKAVELGCYLHERCMLSWTCLGSDNHCNRVLDLV
jgi:hypothetical protein